MPSPASPAQLLKWRFLVLLGSNSTVFRVSCFLIFACRESTSHIDVIEVSQNQRLLGTGIRYYIGGGGYSLELPNQQQ